MGRSAGNGVGIVPYLWASLSYGRMAGNLREDSVKQPVNREK